MLVQLERNRGRVDAGQVFLRGRFLDLLRRQVAVAVLLADLRGDRQIVPGGGGRSIERRSDLSLHRDEGRGLNFGKGEIVKTAERRSGLGLAVFAERLAEGSRESRFLRLFLFTHRLLIRNDPKDGDVKRRKFGNRCFDLDALPELAGGLISRGGQCHRNHVDGTLLIRRLKLHPRIVGLYRLDAERGGSAHNQVARRGFVRMNHPELKMGRFDGKGRNDLAVNRNKDTGTSRFVRREPKKVADISRLGGRKELNIDLVGFPAAGARDDLCFGADRRAVLLHSDQLPIRELPIILEEDGFRDRNPLPDTAELDHARIKNDIGADHRTDMELNLGGVGTVEMDGYRDFALSDVNFSGSVDPCDNLAHLAAFDHLLRNRDIRAAAARLGAQDNHIFLIDVPELETLFRLRVKRQIAEIPGHDAPRLIEHLDSPAVRRRIGLRAGRHTRSQQD